MTEGGKGGMIAGKDQIGNEQDKYQYNFLNVLGQKIGNERDAMKAAGKAEDLTARVETEQKKGNPVQSGKTVVDPEVVDPEEILSGIRADMSR